MPDLEQKVDAAFGSLPSSEENDIGEGTVTEVIEPDDVFTSESNDIGEGTVTEVEEGLSGPPSLQNYMKWATDSALSETGAASAFPEDTDPNLTQAMKPRDPIAEKLSGLGKMDAQMRAKTGAAVGGLIGSQFMGKEGALIGGSIGSVIARGAGMAQSGEQAKLNRDNRIWNSMKTLGAVAPDGKVSFEDGDVQMPSEATGRLKNMRINPLNGNRDRSLYELDETNPLTQKSVLVSKPIAMYLSQGMLGYRNKASEVDAQAPKSATAMLANTLSHGAADADTVYSRARQMVKKMGLKEATVRSYFKGVSKDISIEEAEGIKKAMDILFAKEPGTIDSIAIGAASRAAYYSGLAGLHTSRALAKASESQTAKDLGIDKFLYGVAGDANVLGVKGSRNFGKFADDLDKKSRKSED